MGLFSRRISPPVRPPADANPATLLRWASSFRLDWGYTLCLIARAQAAIADWPSATFTLVQAQQAAPQIDQAHVIAATRWVVEQIRQGADPPMPPVSRHFPIDADTGPLPKPRDGYKRGSLTYASDKAARQGRFENALSLARNLLKSKKWPSSRMSYLNEEVFRFCVIAECQIIHGDLDGARRSLSEALDVAARSPHFWHEWFISNTFNQGLSLRNQGFCAVAKLLADLGDFERAEKLFEIVEGRRSHDITQTRLENYLAVSYARNNEPSNAVRMLLHIPDNTDRAVACVDVVRMLINEPKGQTKWPYNPSFLVTLYDTAMVTAFKAGGPEHPHLGRSLLNYANRLTRLEYHAEAAEMWVLAVAIQEKALGPEHPDVAASLYTLAGRYDTQGKDAEAEPLYQRALAIWEKVLGPGDPQLPERLNKLALCYNAQGKYAEAEPLYQRARAILEKASGPEDGLIVKAENLENYAALLRQTARADEAARMEARAKALRAKFDVWLNE